MLTRSGHDRVRRAAAGVGAAVLVVFAGLGLLVLGHHKSLGNALVAGWSVGYVGFVLLPAALLASFQLALLTIPAVYRAAGRATRLPRYGPLLMVAAVGLIGGWSCLLQNHQTRIFAAALAVMQASLLLFLRGSAGAILGYVMAGLFGILLFAGELPQIAEPRRDDPRPVQWGDAAMFEYLFPKHEPLIGEGGRFRPGVRVRMATPLGNPAGVRFATNRQGFRNDQLITAVPADDELRVLSLGDSFSCGFGINQKQFLGPALQRELSRRLTGPEVVVATAEVSDPAYGLHYLQRHGMKLQPNSVVYGLCGNDVMQTYIAIKMTRTFVFDERELVSNPDPVRPEFSFEQWQQHKYPRQRPTTASVPSRPRTRDVYGLSDLARFRTVGWLPAWWFNRLATEPAEQGQLVHTFAEEWENADGHKRLLDGFQNLGFFYREQSDLIEDMYRTFLPVLEAMHDTAQRSGAAFVLLYYPQRYQVRGADWRILKTAWNLSEDDFDLSAFNRRLGSFCTQNGIAFCDLTTPLSEAAKTSRVFLPHDVHLNSAGYAVAARQLAKRLAELPNR